MENTEKSVINKSINKKDIVCKIKKELNISSEKAAVLFDSIIEELSGALVNGEQVKCANFGTFNVKERAERIGINPQTGEKIKINKTKGTYFHASSNMNGQLNKTEELW